MRTLPFFLFLVVFLVATGSASAKPQVPAPRPPIAIVDVSVVPMDAERLVEHQTVLISGEKITRVGPVAEVNVPDAATIIRGKGLTVLPGMADMHGHLPGTDGADMPIDDYLFLQVARGVTSVRSMRGAPEHVALRQRIIKNELIGPDLVLGSVAVAPDAPLGVEGARALAKGIRKQNHDFIKLLAIPSAEDYRALVAAARAEELPIVGHVPASVGLELVIASGQRSIEHIEPFADLDPADDVAMKQLATQLLTKGVYLCPTLDWYAVQWLRHDDAALSRRHGLEYLPAALRDAWTAGMAERRAAQAQARDREARLRRLDNATQVLSRLSHLNVPLLVGPGDGPFIVPGFGMLHELRALVASGLKPYVALRGATVDASAALGNRPWSTVKKGRRADLILVEGNPLVSLDALDRVRGVILRGRYLPGEEIEAGLEAIKQRAGSTPR